MSPFDMFVLTVFIIATVKAATDAVNFWKEAEEVAAIHFKAADASRKVNVKSSQKSAHTRRASHNISPKHLPAPVRPARMPSGRNVASATTTKPRAIRTGLNNKSCKRKTAA